MCDGKWGVKRLNRGMDCGARSTATLIRALDAGDTEGVSVCMGDGRDHREKPESYLPGGEGGEEEAACFCVGIAPGS